MPKQKKKKNVKQEKESGRGNGAPVQKKDSGTVSRVKNSAANVCTKLKEMTSGVCKRVSGLFGRMVSKIAGSKPVMAFSSWLVNLPPVRKLTKWWAGSKTVAAIKDRTRTFRKSLNAAVVVRWALLLVGVFLVLMPVLPQLPYYFRQLRGENTYQRQETGLYSGADQDGSDGNSGTDIPDVNTLIIPAVGIDVPIVEGSTDDALNYGAWRRPSTSIPPEGGNTVITGHRFRYLPPSNLTFYHLDKVELDDDVIVYWDGKSYDYTVSDIFIVEPEQVEIESNTADPRLTLYTCTPLWTAKQRLVVVATPAGEAVVDDSGTVELEEL